MIIEQGSSQDVWGVSWNKDRPGRKLSSIEKNRDVTLAGGVENVARALRVSHRDTTKRGVDNALYLWGAHHR